MQVSRTVRLHHQLIIVAIGFVAFLPWLGLVPLFDWDEVNFAEIAREMIETNDYFRVQINFRQFYEKPPLFFWLQALSMKIFGVSAFSARLPNVFVGIFTLLSLYRIGTRIVNNLFGILVSGFYFATILSFFYFKSGIIDPLFNLFIFLGVAEFVWIEIKSLEPFRYRHSGGNSIRNAVLAGLWIGLATLTKGPVAIIVFAATYGLYKLIFDRNKFPLKLAGIATATGLGVMMTWFGAIFFFSEEGPDMIWKFILYQFELASTETGVHGQPFYYHILVFLLGCFPMAAFTFRGMALRAGNSQRGIMKRMMVVMFWVVMVLFSAIQTKIVHYSSLLYFPGAWLAAIFLYELIRERKKLPADTLILYGLGVLVMGLGPSLVNIAVRYFDDIAALSKNSFEKATLLQQGVPWSGWEFLPGFLFLIGLIACFYLLIKKKWLPFLFTQMVLTALFLNAFNFMVAPKIAYYTQKAGTDFWESVSDDTVYVRTAGYKSYAPYYFGKVKPHTRARGISPEEFDDWLNRGEDIDRDVYMVAKISQVQNPKFPEWFSNFEKVDEKNGFFFYVRRMPVKTTINSPDYE